MTEKWALIPGVDSHYISDMGRVYNKKTRRIFIGGMHKGRRRVTFYIDGKQNFYYVHRLVAEAFMPGFRHDDGLRHINGDVLDNRLSNLEATGKRIRTLLPKDLRVLVVETGKSYSSINAAARAVGGQPTNVKRVIDGTLKHHKGYTYRFVAA